MMTAPLPRRSWPYLRTPLRIYLLVMLPICALQTFLLINDFPSWMQISGAIVLMMTLQGFVRGYVRRLVLTESGAELRSLITRWRIEWREVRRVGAYLPGGGLGATPYVFISKDDAIPPGAWQIDSRTLQVQDREGLLTVIEEYWKNQRATPGSE